MKKYDVENHEPSLLPDEGEWELVWSDEFDGDTLDMSKWDYRTSMMGKEHPAWVKDGVEVDGESNLVFTLLEKDGKPVSAQLQTGYNFMDQPLEKTKFGEDDLQWNIGKLQENKFLHKYGYYECRCKLQQKYGWWSAFWIQSPMIGASYDPGQSGVECDIMENFVDGTLTSGNIFGGYGKTFADEARIHYPHTDDGEYHRFGVEWNEQGYVFYFDGKETARSASPVSHTEQFVLLSTEIKGYRSDRKKTTWTEEELSDRFICDYVRVFDEVK